MMGAAIPSEANEAKNGHPTDLVGRTTTDAAPPFAIFRKSLP